MLSKKNIGQKKIVWSKL